MKWCPAPEIPKATVERFNAMAAENLPQEQVIQQMRLSGLNIMDCMKLFHKIYCVSRREAKTTVHCSDTWADRRDIHDASHKAVSEALEQLEAGENEAVFKAAV